MTVTDWILFGLYCAMITYGVMHCDNHPENRWCTGACKPRPRDVWTFTTAKLLGSKPPARHGKKWETKP